LCRAHGLVQWRREVKVEHLKAKVKQIETTKVKRNDEKREWWDRPLLDDGTGGGARGRWLGSKACHMHTASRNAVEECRGGAHLVPVDTLERGLDFRLRRGCERGEVETSGLGPGK